MPAKIGAFVAAALLALGALVTKLAHLGPFADEALRATDTLVMSAPEVRANVQALRAGSAVEKQGVEVACAFFTSMATTGEPPEEWHGFSSAVGERVGITSSEDFMTSKLERLGLAVELVEQNPRAAQKYAETCLF